MARSTSSNVVVTGTSANDVSARSTLFHLLISLRPGQWTKNLLIFAGLLFGRRLIDLSAIAAAAAAFAVFCVLSGAVYLVNDVVDRESDRRHPLKARRPIASGALPVSTAMGTAMVLSVVGLVAAFALAPRFGIVAATYVGLFALYSGRLKHIVIIDVLTIAVGFVLRAVAGAVAVDVQISHWLFVCTILLALFIALAKRRHEIVLLVSGATSHRPILDQYSAYLLDQMIAIVAASTLVAYGSYAISPETEERFGTPWLSLTIPFPIYGIFRYLYLVHQCEGAEVPLSCSSPIARYFCAWRYGRCRWP